VIDSDGRFIGAVAIADVVRGAPDEAIESLQQMVHGRVPLDADLQDVALHMSDFNLIAIGVTDDDERLIGAISFDDVLEDLIPAEWRRRVEASTSD
jgi:Mg/Co/Ni transporter MgtE